MCGVVVVHGSISIGWMSSAAVISIMCAVNWTRSVASSVVPLFLDGVVDGDLNEGSPDRTRSEVSCGPFVGMNVLDDVSWPRLKLVGCYELAQKRKIRQLAFGFHW